MIRGEDLDTLVEICIIVQKYRTMTPLRLETITHLINLKLWVPLSVGACQVPNLLSLSS